MIKINIKGVVEAIYSNMELQGTNGLVVWRNNCVEVLTESEAGVYDYDFVICSFSGLLDLAGSTRDDIEYIVKFFEGTEDFRFVD